MPIFKPYVTKVFQKTNKTYIFYSIFIFCLCPIIFCFKSLSNKKAYSILKFKKNFFEHPLPMTPHNEYKHIKKISLKEKLEKDLKTFDFLDNIHIGYLIDQNNQTFSKLSLIIFPNSKFSIQKYAKLKLIIDYLCSTIENLSADKILITDIEGNSYNTQEVISVDSYNDIQNKLCKKELSLSLDSYIQKILPKQHYFFLLNIYGKNIKQVQIDLHINHEYFNLLSQLQKKQLFNDISSLINEVFLKKEIKTNVNFHCSQFLTDHLKLSFKQKITIAIIYFLSSCIIIFSAYIYLISQNFQKKNIFKQKIIL